MNSFVALTNANAQQSGAMPIWGLIGIYAVFFALIWLIFLRPQSKKRKKEEAMRKNAEIGDEITTIGGICGRIVGIKDENTVIIETGSERTKLRIKRWAIGTVETIHE